MGFLGLYWGEGYKNHKGLRNSEVGISNIDHLIILNFIKFVSELSDKVNRPTKSKEKYGNK